MWWHTVTHRRELKGKVANGVGRQYTHTTSKRDVSSITTTDAHTSAASSWLNWCPRWFKWTSPFRWKTKSGFCACAITFKTQSISLNMSWKPLIHTKRKQKKAVAKNRSKLPPCGPLIRPLFRASGHYCWPKAPSALSHH